MLADTFFIAEGVHHKYMLVDHIEDDAVFADFAADWDAIWARR